MGLSKHILIALAIGMIAGIMVYPWQSRAYTSELYPRFCAARALLSGADPYKTCEVYYRGELAAEYPLTTILAFVPLSFFRNRVAASIFWAISNSLLAFAIFRRGKPYHWLIFLSGTYWVAFAWQQFSVIITAAMLLPELLPLALLKPQIGLPVILTNLTRRRLIACAIFVALTFIVFPTWLLSWWQRSNNYDGLIPLITLPLGPLILLALRRWREPDSRFLLLMACMPQRVLSDTTMLLLLPKTARQMFLLCLLSWIPGFLTYYGPGCTPEIAVHLSIVFVYLPLLAMQLFSAENMPAFLTRVMPGRLRRDIRSFS